MVLLIVGVKPRCTHLPLHLCTNWTKGLLNHKLGDDFEECKTFIWLVYIQITVFVWIFLNQNCDELHVASTLSICSQQSLQAFSILVDLIILGCIYYSTYTHLEDSDNVKINLWQWIILLLLCWLYLETVSITATLVSYRIFLTAFFPPLPTSKY